MGGILRRHDDQELICRVSGDAPAGRMMRRYWMPALLSEEMPERGGSPAAVQMFGSAFSARRNENGVAQLADGARAYPTREAGGLVWVYLGPPELEPAFPAYGWTTLPRNRIAITKLFQQSNYLQAVEGAIDSAHTYMLHQGSVDPNEAAARNAGTTDPAPHLECADTCYGFRYAALRKPNGGGERVRIAKMTRYVFPTTALTSRKSLSDSPTLLQIFVPVDNEHTNTYTIWHRIDGQPMDEAALRARNHMVRGVDLDDCYRPLAQLDNWYRQDRAAMKGGNWTGIPGFQIQDLACQETAGPIADHARQHLGMSDRAIIHLRRRMLDAVRRFAAGGTPIGLDVQFDYACLDHIEQVPIGIGDSWQTIQTFPGEYVTPEESAEQVAVATH